MNRGNLTIQLIGTKQNSNINFVCPFRNGYQLSDTSVAITKLNSFRLQFTWSRWGHPSSLHQAAKSNCAGFYNHKLKLKKSQRIEHCWCILDYTRLEYRCTVAKKHKKFNLSHWLSAFNEYCNQNLIIVDVCTYRQMELQGWSSRIKNKAGEN